MSYFPPAAVSLAAGVIYFYHKNGSAPGFYTEGGVLERKYEKNLFYIIIRRLTFFVGFALFCARHILEQVGTEVLEGLLLGGVHSYRHSDLIDV